MSPSSRTMTLRRQLALFSVVALTAVPTVFAWPIKTIDYTEDGTLCECRSIVHIVFPLVVTTSLLFMFGYYEVSQARSSSTMQKQLIQTCRYTAVNRRVVLSVILNSTCSRCNLDSFVYEISLPHRDVYLEEPKKCKQHPPHPDPHPLFHT